jgi:YidC/Oxa1 family membrane protein insertase
MDRNQATGLVLIFAILFAYFTFFAPEPSKPAAKQPKATTQSATTPAKAAALAPALASDTSVPTFKAETITLENSELTLKVSTLGGIIEEATLKKYKTYWGTPLHVFTSKDNQMALQLAAGASKFDVSRIAFTAAKAGNALTLTSQSTPKVVLSYTIDSVGYLVKVQAVVEGQALTAANLNWHQDLINTEKDFTQGRTVATTNYLTTTEEFDHLSETSADKQDEKVEKPTAWVSHKTKFFLTAVLNRGAGFTGTHLGSTTNEQDSSVLKTQTTEIAWQAADLKNGAAYDLYLGPNDYKKLGAVALDFEKNVYLGWPVIRWVNKYIVVNVFHFLQNSISNYGIIIFLLVIFIRILILPLGYSSYLSMAKMRVLKPELDEIKSRLGEDMTAIQQEQMKLYQQVGINPLSGCVPLLLQMPILLAMFNFFPNSIELRQEHLFWAEDLSSWDSIATLPFSIPSYGSHVSLFTILMTISTLAVTYVNSSASTVTGPMASLQYVMPVVFMFILNSLPAGLSYYYLVSNLVSMGQQFLIKRTVNDAKIRAKLDENKVKNATKKPGKFAGRLQDALRQAEEAKKLQQQLKERPKKDGKGGK